jgi:hypothetical protein
LLFGRVDTAAVERLRKLLERLLAPVGPGRGLEQPANPVAQPRRQRHKRHHGGNDRGKQQPQAEGFGACRVDGLHQRHRRKRNRNHQAIERAEDEERGEGFHVGLEEALFHADTEHDARQRAAQGGDAVACERRRQWQAEAHTADAQPGRQQKQRQPGPPAERQVRGAIHKISGESSKKGKRKKTQPPVYIWSCWGVNRNVAPPRFDDVKSLSCAPTSPRLRMKNEKNKSNQIDNMKNFLIAHLEAMFFNSVISIYVFVLMQFVAVYICNHLGRRRNIPITAQALKHRTVSTE